MTWGLPYQLQPDEPTLFINAWERWDGAPPSLSPEYSPLYIYALIAQREFIYRVFGPETPQVIYFFAGRWMTIMINLLILAVAYRVGKQAHSHLAGLSLVLLLAVDPIAVLDQGWIIKADSLGWLLALLTLWLTLKAQQFRSFKWLLLGFLVGGLAIIAKYNMLVVLFGPLWVLIDWRWRSPLKSTMFLLGSIILATSLSWWFLHHYWALEVSPRFDHCAPAEIRLPPELMTRTWEWMPCSPFLALQRYGSPYYESPQLISPKVRQTFTHIIQLQKANLGSSQFWVILLAIGTSAWLYRKSPQRMSVWLVITLLAIGMLLFAMLQATHPNRQYYVVTLTLYLGVSIALPSLYNHQRWLYGLAILYLCLPNFVKDIQGRHDLTQPDTRALTAEFLLDNARRGESVVVEYDWVEFGQQYGGFQAPQGYFNIIGVHGLYDLDPSRFYQEGIYYVVVDERDHAYPTGHYLQQERLPNSFELILDLTDDSQFYGPDRQIYRTFRPQTLVEAQLGSVMQLHGYDLTQTAEGLTLQLYWQAQQTSLPPYSVFIHLIDMATGQPALQRDGAPPRSTDQWEQYEWIFDQRQFDLTDLPTGSYEVLIGVYDPVTGERLPVNGDPSGVLTLMRLEWNGSQD